MADSVSQDRTHQEGTDHIKDTLADRKSDGTTEGTATKSVEPISPAQPPPSNPGASNPSAGIPEGAGGLSSTAHIESPVPNHAEEPVQRIVETIKSLLGFSGETPKEASEASEANDARSAGSAPSEQGYLAAAGATVASAAVATGLVTEHTVHTVLPDRTKAAADANPDRSAVDFRNAYVTPSNSTSSPDSAAGQSSTVESQNADTSAIAAGSTGGGSTSESNAPSGTDGAPNTGVGSTFDSEAKGVAQAEKAVDENKETKGDTSGEKKLKSGTMENRDSIPTAGGEKLGEKHWGESQVVAENPKPQAEDGVSSETADNTAKNTGDPHSDSGDGSKHNMTDKIKDKLHVGKK